MLSYLLKPYVSAANKHIIRQLSTIPKMKQGQRHILIVGGAYAGLSTVQNLISILNGKGCLASPIPLSEPKTLPSIKPRITILDERDGFFHTMGAPLAHSSSSYASTAWKAFNEIPSLGDNGISVLRGRASSLNPADKVLRFKESASGSEREVEYDYLVAATGLKREWPVVPRELNKEGYMLDAKRFVKGLEDVEGSIIVVGGGAVGVEVSSEIKHNHPRKRVILIHSRDRLLSSEPLSCEFKVATKSTMDKLGVEIVLNSRVLGSQVDTANKQTILTLSNGETLTAGKVIFCTAKPTARTDWLPSTVLDENGYVRVNSDMTFPQTHQNSTTHFAAGDIAAWGGIKRVGGALIMGQCAAINIVKRIVADEQNQLEASIQPEQQTLPPFPQMMSLAVGSEAVSFGPDGSVKTGEEVREMAFGDDLGLTRVREVLGFTKS